MHLCIVTGNFTVLPISRPCIVYVNSVHIDKCFIPDPEHTSFINKVNFKSIILIYSTYIKTLEADLIYLTKNIKSDEKTRDISKEKKKHFVALKRHNV